MLATVELWCQRLFIRLCAAQNERTRALDVKWAREIEQFDHEVQTARERGDTTRRELPEQPGAVLSRIPLVVGDDLGTAYTNTGRQSGGTGTEWRGEWGFAPGVPSAATVLTVRLDTPQGSRLACELPLEDLARPSPAP